MKYEELSTEQRNFFHVRKGYHKLPLYKKYMFLQMIQDWAVEQQESISEEYVKLKTHG